MNIKLLIGFLSLLFFSQNTHASLENLDSTPNIKGWGLDLSFGSQPNTDYSTRVSILSPHLFHFFNDLEWRLTVDYIGRKYPALSDDNQSEFALSLESNSAIYKDLVYSFAKFGVSIFELDESIYNETLLSVPLSFGLQVVFRNTEKLVASYFVDYRFSLYNNFEEDDSPANLEKEFLLGGSISFGLRLLF
jgi:hypothetical protein